MKQNLIIKFSPDVKDECLNTISSVLNKYDIDSLIKMADYRTDFYGLLRENNEINFSYIMFCAHGWKEGIGDFIVDSINWERFTSEIGHLDLEADSTLILYCCKGAIKENIEFIFTYGPENLEYIFATTEEKTNEQISLAIIDFIDKKEKGELGKGLLKDFILYKKSELKINREDIPTISF